MPLAPAIAATTPVLVPENEPAPYRVQVFLPSDSTTFGVGNLIAEFENAKNVGYADYANSVPEAFWSVNQDDAKVSGVEEYLGIAHVRILRGNTIVFAGLLLESDESDTDVVFYAYGYLAALFWLLTDWNQSFTTAKVSEIVRTLWERAKSTLTHTNVAFVETGVIQGVSSGDSGVEIELPTYTSFYKRILFSLQELAALGMSDTDNSVIFEITHSEHPTFNWWADKGVRRDFTLSYDGGQITSFRRPRTPVYRRNDVKAVGATPRNAVLRTESADDSDITGFTRDGEWRRYSSQPVVSPTEAWEQTSVQEPVVRYEDGTFKMWAKAGWATSGIGYYTSPDGINWTPYASNPVLGAGGSGHAPEASQPFVMQEGSTYYCYFNSNGDSDPNTPLVWTSADGIAWTGGAASYVTNPGAVTQWGNRFVWVEDGSWHQLLECRFAGLWQILYATSADGLTWTIQNAGNPLSSLAPVAGYDYGGPEMAIKEGDTYHLWYHAGTPGLTDIYHAYSTDLVNWTVAEPSPVLTHLGGEWEVDQVADASIQEVNGRTFMWYAAVNNPGETGRIKLAIFDGPLTELTRVRAWGRRQEPLFLAWVRDQTELDRVTALRKKQALREDVDLVLGLKPNSVLPPGAPGAQFGMADQIRVQIERGITSINRHFMVIGFQVLALDNGEEYLRLMLQDIR